MLPPSGAHSTERLAAVNAPSAGAFTCSGNRRSISVGYRASTVGFPSRLRTWAADQTFALQEGVWDRLLRRQPCPLLPSLRSDPALACRSVDHELDLIFRRVVGRRLTRHVVGSNHSRRLSLTDFLERGAANAQRVLPYLCPNETVLEFGGGVGRLGHWIAPHVRRLVSVDIEPLLKEYGSRLSPGVEFFNTDEVPATPAFDGAYSIAVFFHLTPEAQRSALQYRTSASQAGGLVPRGSQDWTSHDP